MINSQKNFFIALILLGFCIGLYLFGYLKDLDTKELIDYKNNVNVELFGSLVDIIIFGILFYAIQYFFRKKEKIEFLKEQIDDFRDWDEKEASYRIIGIMKRLHKLGVDDINLSRCHFNNINIVNDENSRLGFDFKKANITESKFKDLKLFGTIFDKTYIVKSNQIKKHENDLGTLLFNSLPQLETFFINCELKAVSFSNNKFNSLEFKNTKIIGSFLNNAEFKFCTFINVELTDSKLYNSKFDNVTFFNINFTKFFCKNTIFEHCIFINCIFNKNDEMIINDPQYSDCICEINKDKEL